MPIEVGFTPVSCSLATGRWWFKPVMVYDFVNAIIIAYISVIESMYEKIVPLLIIRGPCNHSAANMPIVYAINYSLPELLADSLRVTMRFAGDDMIVHT
jgi:hypothetical protein